LHHSGVEAEKGVWLKRRSGPERSSEAHERGGGRRVFEGKRLSVRSQRRGGCLSREGGTEVNGLKLGGGMIKEGE